MNESHLRDQDWALGEVSFKIKILYTKLYLIKCETNFDNFSLKSAFQYRFSS